MSCNKWAVFFRLYRASLDCRSVYVRILLALRFSFATGSLALRSGSQSYRTSSGGVTYSQPSTIRPVTRGSRLIMETVGQRYQFLSDS